MSEGEKKATNPRSVANASPKKGKLAVFFDRLKSTVFLWVLLAVTFAVNRPEVFALLLVVIAALGLWEYSRLVRVSGIHGAGTLRWMSIVGVGMLMVLGLVFLREDGLVGVTLPGMGCELGGLVLVVLGVFILWLRYPVEGRRSMDAVVFGIFGYIYVAVLFGAFVLRLLFEAPGEGAAPGVWLVLFVLAATKFTDMGAYITGSLMGKHKMCPRLSPGKTWEGFAGALIFAQLGAVGVWALAGATDGALGWMPIWHVVILGVLVALLAVVGDLAESIIKRSLAVKDSGAVLPGIGGVLDLIDSICFTAPVVYFYMLWQISSGS